MWKRMVFHEPVLRKIPKVPKPEDACDIVLETDFLRSEGRDVFFGRITLVHSLLSLFTIDVR